MCILPENMMLDVAVMHCRRCQLLNAHVILVLFWRGSCRSVRFGCCTTSWPFQCWVAAVVWIAELSTPAAVKRHALHEPSAHDVLIDESSSCVVWTKNWLWWRRWLPRRRLARQNRPLGTRIAAFPTPPVLGARPAIRAAGSTAGFGHVPVDLRLICFPRTLWRCSGALRIDQTVLNGVLRGTYTSVCT